MHVELWKTNILCTNNYICADLTSSGWTRKSGHLDIMWEEEENQMRIKERVDFVMNLGFLLPILCLSHCTANTWLQQVQWRSLFPPKHQFWWWNTCCTVWRETVTEQESWQSCIEGTFLVSSRGHIIILEMHSRSHNYTEFAYHFLSLKNNCVSTIQPQ